MKPLDGTADLVIETLALSEAELLDRVAELEADVQVYRELALAGFDALRSLTRSHERLREQHQRVRDDYRALLEQLLHAGTDIDVAA